MGRPKATDARDTRQEILDAALELFAESGFHGTGLREIARAVGVRESAIYHHFPNKEALFEALIEEAGVEARRAIGLISEQIDVLDLRTAFERLALGALENFATLRERKRYRILMSDGLRLCLNGRLNFMEKSGSPRELVLEFMSRLVKSGRFRETSPEMLALQFISPLMMWRQIQTLSPAHPWVTDYRAFARNHVDNFLRMAASATELSGLSSN